METLTGLSTAARGRTALLLAPAAVALVWLHAATVPLAFIGDDFQWWQHAREAIERPRLLLTPYGGVRLLNTWTLALDHLLFGTAPAGYHLTNVALYLLCGVLLWLAARRLGLTPAARAAVVSLWLISPYSLEPAVVADQRFEPLQLALWLGLLLLWPGPGERWTPRRAAGAAVLAALTAVNKESWVVLPGFTFVFDLWVARRRWREAVARSLAVGAGVGAYLLAYAREPAIAPGTFFSATPANLLKVPNAWAAFSLLAELRVGAFAFGFAELAASLAIALLLVAAWRLRDGLIAVGLAFFLLPFVPLLPIGWSTSRYTTIPLAGFLLAMAGAIRWLAELLGERHRTAVAVACSAAAAAVFAVNVSLLSGDRADYRRYAGLHLPLLAEAGRVAPEVARQDLVLAVRLEGDRPLAELAQGVAGMPKAFFYRGADPYGLIDWSALFSYVLDPVGGPLFADTPAPADAHAPCAVLGHVEGGFVWLESRVPDCAVALAAWRARPAPARMFGRWPVR